VRLHCQGIVLGILPKRWRSKRRQLFDPPRDSTNRDHSGQIEARAQQRSLRVYSPGSTPQKKYVEEYDEEPTKIYK
jgi:hypothetical protein